MRSFRRHRRRLSFVLTKQEHDSCVTNVKLLTSQKDEAVTRYQSRRINGAQRSKPQGRTEVVGCLRQNSRVRYLSLCPSPSLSLSLCLSPSLQCSSMHELLLLLSKGSKTQHIHRAEGTLTHNIMVHVYRFNPQSSAMGDI